MLTTRIMLLIALWMASSVSGAFAQVAISARPGLLLYAEGQVFLGEDQVEFDPAQFATLKSGQRFRVGDGRAELLLSPRALLWMGQHSELEFLSDDLLNVRVRLNQRLRGHPSHGVFRHGGSWPAVGRLGTN